MQILLHNPKTNLYVSADGWTPEIEKATVFPSSVEAMEHCHAALLQDMLVIYSFERRSLNFSVSIDSAALARHKWSERPR